MGYTLETAFCIKLPIKILQHIEFFITLALIFVTKEVQPLLAFITVLKHFDITLVTQVFLAIFPIFSGAGLL